ncbi:ATP-dependent nuclease [Streptomyces sp. NPDC102278]|uniref:ATP-dependent nuclease n=1 Tax=Streptomyces sp. NPDC102278 TaxID=3366152 RepID=UPI00380B2D89
MAITFAVSEIMFTGGLKLAPPQNGMTLFIGPNNSGKTALLKELDERLAYPHGGASDRRWFHYIRPDRGGTSDEFQDWLRARGHRTWNPSPAAAAYTAPGGEVLLQDAVRQMWDGNFAPLMPFLAHAQWTDNRLAVADEDALWDFAQPPLTKLQYLYESRDAEKRFSDLVQLAFGQGVCVDRYDEMIKLRVGRPDVPDVLPGAAHEVVSAYRELPRVSSQGDGFRSFVQVLLHATVRPTPIVIIDEPEAFLHPPQARLLGRLLAGMKGQTQLFVATHSSDFLAGVLEAQERRPLSIVRLDRSSGTPRARVLATEAVEALLNTPLLRYSNLPSGLFYDQVVLCEAAGDCQFYAATFDATKDAAGTHENTLFLNTSGLAALTTTAQHLRQCGIHTAVIADFDILREYGGLRRAFHHLGGLADVLKDDVKAVNDFANGTRVVPTVDGFRSAVTQTFDGRRGHDALTGQMVDNLMKLLKGASGWDVLKRTGLSGLQGNEYAAAQRMLDTAADLGLFIAPCGELESWVRQVPNGRKSAWSRRISEEGWYAKPTPELRAFCESIRVFFKDGVADYHRAVAQALEVNSELGESEASVTNGSSQPLPEVRIIRATAMYEGKLIPGSLWAEGETTIGSELAPGDTFTVQLGKMVWVEHEGFFPREATELSLTVHFRDAAGLWWEREGRKPPTRLINGPSEPDSRPE